jgi:hypothetical protein
VSAQFVSGQSPVGELREFHAFVGAQLEGSADALTPEDLIDLWRDQHPGNETPSKVVAAVEAALADMDAGDTGVPLDEFDRRFRERHGLPPRT